MMTQNFVKEYSEICRCWIFKREISEKPMILLKMLNLTRGLHLELRC